MARLLWLPDVLRAAGLDVREYAGWQTRGPDSYGPVEAVICHGTASDARIETDLRIIAITGTERSGPPIAQLVLDREGIWWVVASGTATGVTTGLAGTTKGLGDDQVLQIEACHMPDEPWSARQYGSYVKGVAALVAYAGDPRNYRVDVSKVVGHYEHQPRLKSDPWFNMNEFRGLVTATMNNEKGTNGMNMLFRDTTGQGWLSDGFKRRKLSALDYGRYKSAGVPDHGTTNASDIDALYGPIEAPAQGGNIVIDAAVLERALAGALEQFVFVPQRENQ